MAGSYSPTLVAQLLRDVRVKQGISARALSLQAGLSPSYVGKLESGEVEPSLYGFSKVATVLRLNRHEVYSIVLLESQRNRQEQQKVAI